MFCFLHHAFRRRALGSIDIDTIEAWLTGSCFSLFAVCGVLGLCYAADEFDEAISVTFGGYSRDL